MKSLLLTTLLLVTLHFYAQPPCGSNPPAGEDCATATPICELNGYCGDTYSYGPDGDTWGSAGAPFGCGFLGLSSCPGTGMMGSFCGSIENDSYLKFVASATTISFNVWVTASTYGDGIQLIVFDAPVCGGNTFTSYYCQQITPGGGATNVSVSGLTVGHTYYIMIDGFAGDLCDYVIGANTGISIPVDVTPLSSTICSGATVNLTATGGNGTYTWNASPNLNTTSGANVVVTPPASPGTYTYTVNSATGNPLCPSSTSATASIIVNSCGCTVTASYSGAICPGGTFDLSSSVVAGATSYSWSGPNSFTASSQNVTGVTAPLIPGTYTYTVNVVSPAGNCTANVSVVVNALPALNAGADVNLCPGGNTTLTASGANVYSWDNTLGAGNSFLVAPISTTVYTVTGTDGNGCVNTDQVMVVINSLPFIDAGSDFAVCQGASATLNGAGGVTYTWNNSVTNGASFVPSATNTYTVSGTDLNGCVNTDQITVTVNALPTVDAGSPVSVCPGQSVTLNGSGATSYSWSNGINNGVAFTPAGTGTYTVTGTDANNCTNIDQVVVTVNTLPTITASAAPASICQGQSTVLTGNGGTSYSWDNGVGAGNNLNASPSATTTYNVSGTDANGCVNTAQVTVTVNPNTPVNAGADQAVCAGQQVTLTASGTPTYSWSNGVTNGTAFTPASTTTYTVTGTSANGCVTTDQVTVTVNALPNINAGADQTVCVGQSVTLVGSNGQTYTWNNGVTNGTAFTVGTTTTYTVTGTDANGCVGTDQVTVTALPVPVADVSSDVTSGSVALQVTFYNNSANATNYTWDFGTGIPLSTNNTNDQVYTYGNAGTYSVVLTASNGLCSDTAMLTITVIPLPPPSVTPPNIFTPNKDGSNDVYFIPYENLASIEVFIQNRWGNSIYEYNTLNGYWDGKVNGKESDEGVYFYKFKAIGLNGEELNGHGFFHLER